MFSGMTAGPSITASRIATFYNVNGKSLATSLTRLATGRKVNQPRDNIGDFFRTERMHQENRAYSIVLREIGAGLALLGSAEEAGTSVFNDLTRMQELTKLYYNNGYTAEEQNMFRLEYEALRDNVLNKVANSYYDNRRLIEDNGGDPLRSITIDPVNFSMNFDIEFDSGDTADASGLDITIGQAAAEAAIQTELNKAVSYLTKVTVYGHGLTAQRNMIDNKIATHLDFEAVISKTDEGLEMAKAVDMDIRQQMSIAMLAQANMLRSSILSLLEF